MENKNKRLRMKFIALALGLALVGTGVGAGLAIGGSIAPTTASAESLTAMTMQASTANDLDSPFKSVYDTVSPSVVGIQINAERQARNGRIVSNSAFVGSGVVISEEGYVVTNYHVVTAGGSEVADDISVIYDGEEYTAKYVAGDEDSDVAVLQVKDLNAPAVTLGNSDALSVGDWALVIGNPLGEMFTNTLSVGVISGVNRTVSSSRSNSTATLIQTDAAINSGNSGGGLFNIRGELVGITSSKMSNNGYYGSASIEGIGLAIPINTVTKIADDLIEYGKVVYPRIGVSVNNITGSSVDEPTSEFLPNCIWVRVVEEGGPAEKAGIEVDDLIMQINGERVKTSAEMQSIIRSMNAGDTIEITVYRIPGLRRVGENEPYPEGEYITFEVELTILDD